MMPLSRDIKYFKPEDMILVLSKFYVPSQISITVITFKKYLSLLKF